KHDNILLCWNTLHQSAILLSSQHTLYRIRGSEIRAATKLPLRPARSFRLHLPRGLNRLRQRCILPSPHFLSAFRLKSCTERTPGGATKFSSSLQPRIRLHPVGAAPGAQDPAAASCRRTPPLDLRVNLPGTDASPPTEHKINLR
uniref:Uncharacterized protein n=1 Tax=Aegilops tauschii subsp. strangulata TaxID=200361 RepID=A0A453DTN9_AEGTS